MDQTESRHRTVDLKFLFSFGSTIRVFDDISVILKRQMLTTPPELT